MDRTAITFSEKTNIRQVPHRPASHLTSPGLHLEPDFVLGPRVENQENNIATTATDLPSLKPQNFTVKKLTQGTIWCNFP
jgi:hypothetical protein